MSAVKPVNSLVNPSAASYLAKTLSSPKNLKSIGRFASTGLMTTLGALKWTVMNSPAIATSLYLNYMMISQIYEALSKLAGTYTPLEGGETKVVFSPVELGQFFGSQSSTGSSWSVTDFMIDTHNLKDIQEVLVAIYEHVDDPQILNAMTAQVLTKLFANKNSKFILPGVEVKIPTFDSEGNKQLVSYTCEEKFNLWQNIPAFGFVDLKGQFPPIVLFRGTNINLLEQDALPTMVENLHPQGPGWNAFDSCQDQVKEWLLQKLELTGLRGRTVGFSQGGLLSSYFLAHHPELFNQNELYPSIILDSPGVNRSTEKTWQRLRVKPHVVSYVNRGDLIPKLGSGFFRMCF